MENIIKKAKNINIIDNLQLIIQFSDGERRILDIKPFCNSRIFKPFLENKKSFESVEIDSLGGIAWSNGASLSPETIYLKSEEML